MTLTRKSFNDSPWFWASMFLTAALLALVLAGPKFSWRQPQIERQYQARQRSGHSVLPEKEPTPYSQSGRPMISLGPLYLVLSLLLLVTWSVWMWQRFRPEDADSTQRDLPSRL
jgi:hypothetical protein